MADHIHVSPATVRAQVTYSMAKESLETARNLITAKLQNCYFLLGTFRQARIRAQSDQVQLIDKARRHIHRHSEQTQQVIDKQSLFLTEAQAAHVYWDVFARLCHAPASWRRCYPHAHDGLNMLLNAGYVTLARQGFIAVAQAGLVPEIGVLHGDNAQDGLVFDLIEPWRQPIVDAAIISLLSRRQKTWKRVEERTLKKGFAVLHARWQKRVYYRGRCETIRRVLLHEAISLREAITYRYAWQPFHYRWGHHTKC